MTADRKEHYWFSHFTQNIEDYAIVRLNNIGDIQDWNKGAEHIKGYSAEEVIGRNFSIFYTKDDLQKHVPQLLMEQAAKKGKAESEGWRVRKDGSVFWGNISITAIYNDESEPDGFIKITRDLSERKKAEQLLLQKNAMLLEAERVAKMCSWSWDINTDSFGWSESACDIFEIDIDFTLSYRKLLRMIYEEDREEVNRIVDRILATKQFNEFSFRIMNASGHVKDLICMGEVTCDDKGHAIKAIGTLQDITEKKNYIKYIDEKNKQLADIAQLQSHAVRNHVANILGLVEILDIDNTKIEDSNELIRQLAAATQKLDEITKSIISKTY